MDKNLCNKIKENMLDKNIVLYGWIHNKRIFKNLVFLEIRNIFGRIQSVFHRYTSENTFNYILKLKHECCIKIVGLIKLKKNIFNSLNKFEIEIKKINLLGDSSILPINIYTELSEYQKLKFRYLYLRNSNVQNTLKIRSKIYWYTHKYMNKNNFMYIETPILTNFSNEGSKYYIVPSRLYKNKYYGLSQSPQLFKQILMISGYNRYYQIAKCFRDEDLRSDRQPEFTQIDIEVSFEKKEFIYKFSNNFIKYIFKNIKGYNIDSDIYKITFKESMENYGTDKPDLRNPLKIYNINNFFLKEDILDNELFNNKIINIIYINDKKINDINKYLNLYNNTKFIVFKSVKLKENLKKLNIYNEKLYYDILKYYSISVENNNDLLILNIDEYNRSINIMGDLRNKLCIDMSLINKNKLSIIWVTDFPMFKINNETKNIESMHHPFTLPKENYDIESIISNPMSILSNSYDLVLNGYEIASGSLRISNRNLQEIVFNILGISKKEQEKKFGFLLDALNYGAPPHLGIAFGLDRLVMLILDIENIKDVIAFPKSTSAFDFMTNSPNYIDNE